MSNVVEAIFVQLGLDAGSYTEDAQKASAQNDRLTASLEKTETKSAEVGKALEGLKGIIGTVTKTVTGLAIAIAYGTGLAKLADEARQANEELNFLSKNLNMSTQSIAAWRGAAEASGGSAAGMTASIKGLNKSMNDFIVMGDASMLPYFNALGVGMVDANGKARDMNEVMLDLSESLSKMDRAQAHSVASGMGLDEGTINTLLQGRDTMQEMLDIQKEMYQSSEQDLENSREMSKQQAIMAAHWNSLKLMIGNSLVPVFTKLFEIINGIFSFIQKHQNTAKHVFEGLAIFIGMVLTPILYSALAALIAFIAPFAPFILIVGALAAAFILLYDDYKTWAEGGQSLFDWGWFGSVIDNATGAVDKLKTGFNTLQSEYVAWTDTAVGKADAWLRMKGFIDENGLSVKSLINGFKNLAKEVLDEVIPTLKGYASIIQKIFTGDFAGAMEEAGQMLSNFAERADDTFNELKDKTLGAIDDFVGNDKNSSKSLTGTIGQYNLNTSGAVEAVKTGSMAPLVSGGSSLQGNNVAEKTMALIRKHEGFKTKAYWDVNAYRTGYGSDTVTGANGKVSAVTKNTVIDKAGAERDLVRRSAIFAKNAEKQVGSVNWNKLPNDAKAALTSVAYNYGSLPQKVVEAVKGGKLQDISNAVRSLQGHNNGVNSKRRNNEADIIASSSVLSSTGSTSSASNAGNQSLKKASQKTADAADFATANALGKSAKKCAKYVNDALRSQGIKISGNGHEVAANLLKSNQGFERVVYNDKYVPMKGDVMSMPSYNPQKQGHNYGHVAIYDGKQWVSDFKQGNKYGNTGAAAQGYFDMIKRDPSKATIARKQANNQPIVNTTAQSNLRDFSNAGSALQNGSSMTNDNRKTVDIQMGDIKVYTASSTVSGVANDAFGAFNNQANQLMTGMA